MRDLIQAGFFTWCAGKISYFILLLTDAACLDKRSTQPGGMLANETQKHAKVAQ